MASSRMNANHLYIQTSDQLVRVRDYVYTTHSEALDAGWKDAEYGWWVPANGDLSRARWGWIALDDE